MLKVREAIIVEGKYDRIRLSSVVDGLIIETNGFSLFQDPEKRELIRKLAEQRGILILTDSDSAGFLIRNHIRSFVPPEQIRNAYIPQKPGRERRKKKPSKQGLLGVEGIDAQELQRVLEAAGAGIGPTENPDPVRRIDLYEWGLSGGENSAAKRKLVQEKLGLPSHLSASAFLEVLNTFTTRTELSQLLLSMSFDGGKKTI